MQPKIHKEDNPGRPVISSVNCHTAKISQYVDHHLQSHVQELDSYVEDSTNLIKKVSTIDKYHKETFLWPWMFVHLQTSSLDETDLVVVRRLIHWEVSPECINEESLTERRSYNRQVNRSSQL